MKRPVMRSDGTGSSASETAGSDCDARSPSQADDLFDEDFLASVDRARLALKQQDPFRVRQLSYALEEEIRHDRSALIHQDRIPDRG